jgi:general nucleoside transport system ATP-binding protein
MIVSTELDEVMQLADRIAVLYRGRLVGIVPATTSRDVLGLMMAGVPANEAAGSVAASVHSGPTAAAAPEPAGHEGEAHV